MRSIACCYQLNYVRVLHDFYSNNRGRQAFENNLLDIERKIFTVIVMPMQEHSYALSRFHQDFSAVPSCMYELVYFGCMDKRISQFKYLRF